MGRGGLLLVCCGALIGEGARLFTCPRRVCVGKSCRFVRFVRFSLRGGLVVVVASVVIGGFVVVVVVFAVTCGESVGGIADSAHSVPPGVRSHVGVGVGGIAGSAHKVPPGVLSSLGRSFVGAAVGASVVVKVSVGAFVVVAAGVGAPVLFADLTILSQFIVKGKLLSGLP